MKKVSVIVPVYNVEKYVGKCIDSIINQTYTNLEILINNDGSTDNSYEICKTYAEKDSRIKLFSQENRGLSAARNAVYDEVTGDYIFFVDSDDWLLPECIERLVILLEKNNADASACGFYKAKNEDLRHIHRTNKVSMLTGEEFADRMTRLIGYRCVAWGRLIKREYLQDLYFPDGRIFEDIFVMPKLFMKFSKIASTRDPMYIYRQRQDGFVHSSFKIARTDELDGYISLIKTGFEYRCKMLVKHGIIYFIPNYFRFMCAIKKNKILAGRGYLRRYVDKYSPYLKVYSRMLFTNRYECSDLIYKEPKPLR